MLGIALPALDAPAEFAVWSENWPALDLFLSLSTQWRLGAMGGVLGLDYTAAEAVMRIRRLPDRPALFEALQVMERAALTIINAEVS